MKCITIKSCLDCPLAIVEEGNVYCNSAKYEERLHIDKLERFIQVEEYIPNSCPLTDFNEKIREYFLENLITIQNQWATILGLVLLKEDLRDKITHLFTMIDRIQFDYESLYEILFGKKINWKEQKKLLKKALRK